MAGKKSSSNGKQVASLRDLKKKHKELYELIKEKLKDESERILDYELDYFVHNKSTNEYFLTLSLGIGEELKLIDISGEMIDDEVSINSISYDRSMSKDDFFDPDSAFIREMMPDEDEHDSDY